jgi:hypothetical protein
MKEEIVYIRLQRHQSNNSCDNIFHCGCIATTEVVEWHLYNQLYGVASGSAVRKLPLSATTTGAVDSVRRGQVFFLE